MCPKYLTQTISTAAGDFYLMPTVLNFKPKPKKNGLPALLGDLSERKEKEMFIIIYEVSD